MRTLIMVGLSALLLSPSAARAAEHTDDATIPQKHEHRHARHGSGSGGMGPMKSSRHPKKLGQHDAPESAEPPATKQK